tara:strand:+ start:331 stop:915 length:585 start_codon:yes stop_codon:yes gene_type:complete
MDKSKNTTKQMKTIVDKELTSIYSQLYVNAEKICTYNFKVWGDDLIASTIEYFLKMPIEKQYKIVTSASKKIPALERYLTSAMSLQVHSSTSPFYSKYRKPIEMSRELFPDYDYSPYIGSDTELSEGRDSWELMKDQIPQLITELDYYNKYLIQKHFIEQLTISEISELTHITNYRLSKDIKIALLHLKKQLTK